MMLLEAENLSVRYGGLTIVEDVSFSLAEGDWLMVVGPNGAGKSTLINAVSQSAPYTGSVRYLGRELSALKARERAKCIGVLAQSHFVGYSFSVGEVVRLGRYAYSPHPLSGKSAQDEESVERALALTGLSDIEGQSALTLSGGELQRAFLAQLFAQDPKILLLDEPTNHLDLVYQKQIFALISEWLKTPGRAVISVVHDLSLAKAYGSKALLLDRGRTVSCGSADSVFSRENLAAAYDIDVYGWMRDMLSQWQ